MFSEYCRRYSTVISIHDGQQQSKYGLSLQGARCHIETLEEKRRKTISKLAPSGLCGFLEL